MTPTLKNHFKAFIESLKVRNLSEQTISSRQKHGDSFLQWCGERDITTPDQLDRGVVDAYQRHVFRQRKRGGLPYAVKSQLIILDAMRSFCRFLARTDVIERDVSDRMTMPRMPEALPKSVLSQADMQKVLAVPDTRTPAGVRDRAILEVLWATGIRRAELVNLDIYSIDFGLQTLVVRQGKGNRDRVVPIGIRALEWVQKYLDESRPALRPVGDSPALFLNVKGRPMTRINLSSTVRRHILDARINKIGSCHLIRHSVGTMLMQNGLNIRLIQQLLGHKKLETTQLYTHMTIMDLKKAYKRAHPSAK